MENHKFKLGNYCKTYINGYGNSYKRFVLNITNITKTGKLSFKIYNYLDSDYDTRRFCRKILTDNKGNEYLEFVDLYVGPKSGADYEIFGGDGFKLDAKELQNFKVDNTDKRYILKIY